MTKVAVVTGGSRGIGSRCAVDLARHGWDVVVGFRHGATTARDVAAEVEALGQRALAFQVDIASEGEVVEMFRRARSDLGAIGALVNSAGITDVPCRVDEMDAERISRMMAVNVLGSFLCAREAVRTMSSRHGGAGGSIVNVSSGASRIGSPGEYVDYAASKGAVDVLTIGLAKEVGGEGIRVNAVRPGLIDTEIHARGGQPQKLQRVAPTVPVGRAGRPEEVAAAITWLCSEDASYVNGAILDVAGGR